MYTGIINVYSKVLRETLIIILRDYNRGFLVLKAGSTYNWSIIFKELTEVNLENLQSLLQRSSVKILKYPSLKIYCFGRGVKVNFRIV